MLLLQIAAVVALGALALLALPWLLDQVSRGLLGVAVVLFGGVLVALLVADPNNAEATFVIAGAGVVIGAVGWWSYRYRRR